MTAEEIIFKEINEYKGYFATNDGRIYSAKTDKFLKMSKDKQGYLRVGLSVGYYKSKTIKVQRLIAEAFIPSDDKSLDVNHIDGNKENNSVANLEWCTRSENCKHAFSIGLSKIGDRHRKILRDAGRMRTGENNRMARKVINNDTGKIYPTVTSAAKDMGLKYSTLAAMLCGQNPNKTSIIYYEK